jgi:hypothetical protein
MNKKNLIQVLIIVACFAASAIVIYNNFLKKEELPPSAVGQNEKVGQKQDGQILPGGATFDLKSVKESKLRFNLIDYPKVSLPSDIGLDTENILKPLVLLQDGTNTIKK